VWCTPPTPCTVKKTFEAAADTGNFLIAQLKANQQNLLDAIEAISAADQPADTAETVDRNRHGRQEHRLVETFDVAGRLGADWDGLIGTVARVTRLTWHKDTKTGLWRQTNDRSLYASQINLPATVIGAAIRHHWGIENRNHHVRDVTFFEDLSRIRTKPGHFARFRTFALNILRANGVENVSRELYINALNSDHALSYQVT
jgi:predicted transposase YbfD/YdcC